MNDVVSLLAGTHISVSIDLKVLQGKCFEITPESQTRIEHKQKTSARFFRSMSEFQLANLDRASTMDDDWITISEHVLTADLSLSDFLRTLSTLSDAQAEKLKHLRFIEPVLLDRLIKLSKEHQYLSSLVMFSEWGREREVALDSYKKGLLAESLILRACAYGLLSFTASALSLLSQRDHTCWDNIIGKYLTSGDRRALAVIWSDAGLDACYQSLFTDMMQCFTGLSYRAKRQNLRKRIKNVIEKVRPYCGLSDRGLDLDVATTLAVLRLEACKVGIAN